MLNADFNWLNGTYRTSVYLQILSSSMKYNVLYVCILYVPYITKINNPPIK